MDSASSIFVCVSGATVSEERITVLLMPVEGFLRRGDVVLIRTPGGKLVLLPAVPAFLDRIDIDTGIYIRPIPGFFDEEDGDAL